MALPRACGSPRCVWLQIGNGESLCRSGSPSPTHVGMDPVPGSRRVCRCPKPHARGDGPKPVFPLLCTLGQAPRTWGWTELRTTTDTPENPSPTHVGMDRRARAHTDTGVPQAPRTWGWTGAVVTACQVSLPSPTHVGMDRRARAHTDTG